MQEPSAKTKLGETPPGDRRLGAVGATDSADAAHRYAPIRDYAAIGDCHGSSLISRDGSVDWCCLGRFDAPPVFCRLLDTEKGGCFSLRPEGAYEVSRAYLGRTNILQTTFTTPSGVATVTDFMPVGRSSDATVHDYVTLNAPGWLVRTVECVQGRVTMQVHYRPCIDFARRRARLEKAPYGLSADRSVYIHADVELAVMGDLAAARLDMCSGERQHFVVSAAPFASPVTPRKAERLLAITQAFWNEWMDYCRYRGPYEDAVRRSALVLKLLTYAPSGAIVAAPTTSLPESIGGDRNWDYRYCWPRDVTFTLFALGSLGYSGESRRFADFLYNSCRATHPRVQIMYGIDGETELEERTLDHLDGYRGSRPVNVGNGAYRQTQLDVYGELLDWAHLHRSLGGRFDRESREFLSSIAGFVAKNWQEPDQGIWEMRGPPQHHVFGKIMSWVAVDRAVRVFGEADALTASRDAIRQAVLTDGVRDGHLVQVFGGSDLDAALLLAPMVGFPADCRVIEATVNAIQQRLRVGDFVKRYRHADGLRGEEGAFLVCSFWLVDALLALDRGREARELYERLLQTANDVGLYSEETNPETGEFLGNFPQALTHLGVINSAVHLGLYEKRGAEALRGSHADRAKHTVQATAGLRALWTAFQQTGRVGRLRSSRRSILRTDSDASFPAASKPTQEMER